MVDLNKITTLDWTYIWTCFPLWWLVLVTFLSCFKVRLTIKGLQVTRLRANDYLFIFLRHINLWMTLAKITTVLALAMCNWQRRARFLHYPLLRWLLFNLVQGPLGQKCRAIPFNETLKRLFNFLLVAWLIYQSRRDLASFVNHSIFCIFAQISLPCVLRCC